MITIVEHILHDFEPSEPSGSIYSATLYQKVDLATRTKDIHRNIPLYHISCRSTLCTIQTTKGLLSIDLIWIEYEENTKIDPRKV